MIGADRIDLFAGHGPFTLTPFLVLAPLVVFLHFFRNGLRGKFHLAISPSMRRQLPFLAVSSAFLLLAFASIPLGLDPERGLVAFCDLLLVAVLGYGISLEILEEPEREKLIERSVTFAVTMYLIFCIGECIAWNQGLALAPNEKPTSLMQVTFAPSMLGNWIPTLSGTTSDANRSGFVLTMYLVLLDRFVTRSRYTFLLRFAIGLFIFLTLSRSGVLCWLAYYFFSSTFWARLRSRRALLRAAAIAVVCSLLCVVYQKEIVGLAETWEISDAISVKMSMGEGSSGESHILLIQRGFETWLRSTKTVLAGIGFASAPKVLEDFFGSDKRGNFHCLYVTALAEMGFPAFVFLMVLLFYPVIGRMGALSPVVAIMSFNISYQSHLEPMFWLILALLWSYERRDRPALRYFASPGQYGTGSAIA
ncbi:MAG: O-antigen ligase family protein [Candidatus Sulfotelmatobacter sp.]